MNESTHIRPRIHWVDVAKGIGIILVSFGHIRNEDGQSVWLPVLDTPINAIYLFHMPLFFFLGGLTFNTRHEFIDFAWRRVRTLIVPYYVFSLYFLMKPIALLVMPSLSSTLQSSHNYDLESQFYSVLVEGGGLWFLWAYFWGEIIAYILIRWALTRQRLESCNQSLLYGFVGVIIIGGYTAVSGVFPGMGLPFQMLKGIEVSGFILLGLAGRRWLQGLQRRISSFLTILTVIGYAAFATIAVLATSAHSSLWIALASTLAMFFGVYAFTFISIAIQKKDLLEYVGRNSLVFYAVNAFMLNVGKLVFFRVLPINGVALPTIMQWIVGLLLVAFSMVLMWGANVIIHRWLWWSIGAKRPVKVVVSS